jgi:hypothetical protein
MLRRKHSMLVGLSFLAVLFQGSVQGASVIYRIENYPKQQDGWTLSGTITINAKAASGNLDVKDITAWSWTIAKGSESYTYKSTDEGGDVGVEITGTVSYTAKQILLPVSPKPGNSLDLMSDSGYPDLAWRNVTEGEGASAVYFGRYLKPNGGQPPKSTYAWFESSQTLGGRTTWVIATAVPEPPAVVLAGLGFACLVLYTTVRPKRTGFQRETRERAQYRALGRNRLRDHPRALFSPLTTRIARAASASRLRGAALHARSPRQGSTF